MLRRRVLVVVVTVLGATTCFALVQLGCLSIAGLSGYEYGSAPDARDLAGDADTSFSPPDRDAGGASDADAMDAREVEVDANRSEMCPDDKPDKCDSGCVNTRTDRKNCGRCGNACEVECGDRQCLFITSISAGSDHTCALLKPAGGKSGSVWCWGSNEDGRLGINQSDRIVPDKWEPVRVAGFDTLNVSDMSTGYAHTCAVLGEGADRGEMVCWGANDHFQLGIGLTVDGGRPPAQLWPQIHVLARPGVADASPARLSGVDGGDNWSLGGYNTFVKVKGAWQAWGQNGAAELGVGLEGDQPYPLPVNPEREVLNNVTKLVSAEHHTCVIEDETNDAGSTVTGVLKCWGMNDHGQLGIGTESSTAEKKRRRVDLPQVGDVDVGAWHTCAILDKDRSVQCWGYNEYGQADPTTKASNILKPQNTVPLDGRAKLVALGRTHSCAILEVTGKVKCWGSNNYGELGVNGGPGIRGPVEILSLTDVEELSVSTKHTCALTKGIVKCWGKAEKGRLGVGLTAREFEAEPKKVVWP